MKETSPVSVSRGWGTAFAVCLVGLLSPSRVMGQLPSKGYPVTNPEWEILVTDWGYADLALDNRPGFVGREYLSGEWAAAVHYAGGQNPVSAIWFEPQWFYPDWVSDSNFGVEAALSSSPANASGFTVYHSVITNRDLRVTLTYEMLDTTSGIAMGMTPKSAGGAGSSVLSSRYVFRQSYRITNLSGGALTSFKLYQFLHGLQMTNSLYDDRLYAGGGFSDYHADITQQGQSYGFDSRTSEIVHHTDTMTFHSQMMPGAWENGYYGKKGVDDHVFGKPSVGVHWSVEGNSLNDVDSFSPPELRWVAGAQRYDLGTLAANASVTNDVLLSLKSSYTVAYPGVNLVIRGISQVNTNLNLDFQETLGGPLGFILHKSTNVTAPLADWQPVLLPYYPDVPRAGWNRFQVPVDPAEPVSFYCIEAVIRN